MLIGVRHQSQETGALDGGRQLTLVAGLGTGDAGRDDLAVFGDEILEEINSLVIDFLDAFGSEAAELATLEELASMIKPFSIQRIAHAEPVGNFACYGWQDTP